MIGEFGSYDDRLYLSKKPDKEIYLDLKTALQQHHIDGIRFIYNQFAKETPGVILSDPQCNKRNRSEEYCSHALSVVLFINAIRTCLHKANLILCDQSNLRIWEEYFQKFTDCCDEVAVDVSNPFLKKHVFIVPMERLESFSRRDWGVIVVDDMSFFRYKNLPDRFNAEFKILITAENMQVQLETFSVIYKWLYPKEKIDIEEFRANKKNIHDVIEKSIKFQAFTEDILIRTDISPSVEVQKYPPPVNRVKNKDATGTKIKRSRRKLDEDNIRVPNVDRESQKLSNDLIHVMHDENNASISYNSVNISNNEDKDCNVHGESAMDVEYFIRNEEPIKTDDISNGKLCRKLEDIISPSSNREKIEDHKTTHEENPSVDSTIEDDAKVGNTEDMQLHYSDDTFENHVSKDSDDDLTAYSLETQILNPNAEDEESALSSNIESNPIVIDNSSNVPEESVPSESKSILDINDKLKELEEKTLKKFKGSLLDRIF